MLCHMTKGQTSKDRPPQGKLGELPMAPSHTCWGPFPRAEQNHILISGMLLFSHISQFCLSFQGMGLSEQAHII